MRVTIKTIAAEVGVSPATVSNAYNRPDQLSTALRERILAKAAELGYDGPNAAAHALRSGHAGAIGVVLSPQLQYAFSDPFAVEFLRGMSEACSDSGTGLLLLPLTSDGLDTDLASLRRAPIDGLTEICLLEADDLQQFTRGRHIPYVGTFADLRYDHVAIDDEQAGFLLGEHLAALGHRRVVVAVDSGRSPDTRARRLTRLDPGEPWDPDLTPLEHMWHIRVHGVRRAMPDAEMHVISVGTNSIEAGRQAGAYVMQHSGGATAAIGVSDVLALGIIEEVTGRGMRVPEDLSVCGVDDIPQAGAAGLTTVRQPTREKGRRVAELLLDRTLEPRQVILPVTMIERATTARAR